ncbi:MAG TPA: cupin domain-containing protein [Aestuariivirgaceae bacterium]|nr:cupin domain-containing protein [Aestuariivirgaceae bacterium]
MNRAASIVVFGALSTLAWSLGPAFSQDGSALPQGFEAKPLLKSTTTADGDAIQFPTGNPEIVSVIGTIAPNGRTALHQHPVPVYVYVLEGSLSVKTEGAEARNYAAGEAFLESVGKWHQAFNESDQPARILVVFMGEEGKPTTEAKQ